MFAKHFSSKSYSLNKAAEDYGSSASVLSKLTVPDVKFPPVAWGLSPKLISPITLEATVALSDTSCLSLV